MVKKIKISIVDDQPLFRESIRSLIKCFFPQFRVISEADSHKTLLSLLEKEEPEYILLDLDNASETIDYLKKYHPKIQILAPELHNKKVYSDYLMKKQIQRYLADEVSGDVTSRVKETMRALAEYFTEFTVKPMLESVIKGEIVPQNFSITRLTIKYQQVIGLVCLGYNNKEIGEILFVNDRTIESWRRKIMIKIGVKNKTDLIRYGLKNGLDRKFGYAKKR